jgi:hypothetical protein
MRVPTGVGLAWDFAFIVARIFVVVARAAARLVLMFVLLFLLFMLALFGASLVGAALVEWLGNPPESIRTGISWAMLAGACALTLGLVVLGYRRFAFVRWAFGALGSLAYLATGDAVVDVAMRTESPGAGRIGKAPSGGSVDKDTEPHVLRVNGRPVPWKRRTTERRK